MPASLEGGCLVGGLREGEALARGNLKIWRHVGRAVGAEAITLRVLECGPGSSPGLRNGDCDEVLYVLQGEGTIFLDGEPHRVAPETGIYLRPGVPLSIQNPGPAPLTLVSSQCPDPGPSLSFESALTLSARVAAAPQRAPVVRFADRETHRADDQRWYRVLIDDEVGSTKVTQFVGAIPAGRAPDHFHEYEEVICILTGSGRVWAGPTCAPVERGSFVFLPRRQPHCVENTGGEELRLLGIFYPAGSPAVRYPAS